MSPQKRTGRNRYFLTMALAGLLISCQEDQKATTVEIYEGPIRVLYNAEIEHSDSSIISGKLITPELLEFDEGNRELPAGGNVEFYNDFGEISATLVANYAYFTQDDQVWRIEGNVVLNNIENSETLKTEQLFWNPQTGKVYTEKFVRIEREDEILTGTGLEASQDFSSYVIKKPEGTFNLEE